MRNNKKIVCLIIIIFMLFVSTISNYVYARPPGSIIDGMDPSVPPPDDGDSIDDVDPDVPPPDDGDSIDSVGDGTEVDEPIIKDKDTGDAIGIIQQWQDIVDQKKIEELEKKEQIQNPLQNPDSYKPGDLTTANKLKGITQTIVAVITNIGVVIATVIIMFLGFRYLFGSVEERANYKETMVPYLIGAVLLFSGTIVTNLIYGFVINL